MAVAEICIDEVVPGGNTEGDAETPPELASAMGTDAPRIRRRAPARHEN